MAIAFARYQVPTTTLLRALTLRSTVTTAPAIVPAPPPVPHPAALLPAPFHPVVIRPAISPAVVAPAPAPEVAAPVKETTPTSAATCTDCKPTAPVPVTAAIMAEASAPAPAPAPVKVTTADDKETPSTMPSNAKRVIVWAVVAVVIGGLLVYAAKVRP